jgi:hypothetical protein
MATPYPTREALREILHYDPETGFFTWLVNRKHVPTMGKRAGCTNKTTGYVFLLNFVAHRLAWIYMTGETPKGQIDHINGARDDNRFCNLRDVSRTINQQNMRRAFKTKRSGLPLGVFFTRRLPNAYMAQIVVRGKQFYIGSFQTPEAAHEAYLAAKRKRHDGCTI